MSDELGLVNYGDEPNKEFMFPGEKDYSEKTAEQIDIEIKRLIDEAYGQAKSLMEENRDEIKRIASALLKYETLDAKDVELILEGGELDKPTVSGLLAAEQAKTEESEDKEAQAEESDG